MTADAGIAAARERVVSLFERLSHVELGVVVVAAPDAARLAARDRARDAAIIAGRTEVLDEATEAARTTAMRMFSSAAFSGTWAATEMAASVASAADRVAAANAFEEAATAAVVEDLVDDETLETLRATTDELARSSTISAPGSLASLTSPIGQSASRRGGILLPTAVLLAAAVGAVWFGSVIGAIAGAFLVAAGAWLFGRRPRPEP